ncbi:MAG: hypothetical protein KW802_01550 [Candidatus Doudnabacteria bacterium]|nr:hypothetical protein [Candidatus Doudnabacteria bacterium]
MPEINLLQNQLKDTTHVGTTRSKVVTFLALAFLVVMGGWGALLYMRTQSLTQQVGQVSGENVTLRQQIESGDEKLENARAYQAQLSNLKLLLKDHVFITPLLEELSKYTYLRASYSSLDVSQDLNKAHLEGTVESYDSLGKLLLGLSLSKNVNNVKLLTVQAATEAANNNLYNFSIDFTVKPEIFNQK